MKKIIIILGIVIPLLVGCSSENNTVKEEYIWGTENVNVDIVVEKGYRYGFNIPFAYVKEKDDIELVSIEGDNTDSLELEVSDDTIDDFDKAKVDNYRLGYLGVIYSLKEDVDVTVESLNININGSYQQIKFEPPLIIRAHTNDTNICEYLASGVLMHGKNNFLTYTLSWEENVKILDCGLTGAFDTEEITVFVDGKQVSARETEVLANTKVQFDLTSRVEDKYEDSCLAGNFFVTYMYASNEEKTYYISLNQQGAGDAKSAQIVLEQIIERDKK